MQMTHPTLYGFIGKSCEIAKEMVDCVKKTHSKNHAFFLYLENAEIDEQVRKTKVQMQLGNGGLNLQRVHMYLVVDAYKTEFGLVESAGARLRTLFEEDFTGIFFTLAVMISESNDVFDFKERNMVTYAFLRACELSNGLFDSVFLLSDRNEFGVVSDANWKSNCALLAYLPLLHQEMSYFDEILAAKVRESDRILFASGGLSDGNKYDDGVEDNLPNWVMNRTLHSLAQCLDDYLCDTNLTEMQCEWQASAFSSENALAEKIKRDIVSVAAKPLTDQELEGLTLKEMENMLFGENVQRFFEVHYCGLQAHHSNRSLTMTLPQAVAEEKQLSHALTMLSDEISQLTQKLETLSCFTLQCAKKIGSKNVMNAFVLSILSMIEHFICKPSDSSRIDDVKTAIAEQYAATYLLAQRKAAHAVLAERHDMLSSYISHIKAVVETIKSLPTEAPQTVLATPSQLEAQTAINISLLRDDGLIHEKHCITAAGNPCFIKLIGGFQVKDLVRYQSMQKISRQSAPSSTL